MQLNLSTLAALVVPFLALTAAVPTNPKKIPVCQSVCVTSDSNPCPDFNDYTNVVDLSVKVRVSQEVAGTKKYGKKQWFIHANPKVPDASSDWYGGHVSEDGSIVQWARGPKDVGKLHAFRYTLTDPTTQKNELVYYWQAGGGDCRGEAGNFKFYGSLTAVQVLTAPAAK